MLHFTVVLYPHPLAILEKSILGSIIGLTFLISFGYFSYGLVQSYTNDEFSVNSDKVWCANCQTYHDKQTAEQEKQDQELVWCINCKKYHAPGLD